VRGREARRGRQTSPQRSRGRGPPGAKNGCRSVSERTGLGEGSLAST
jgi:hypothetical protein